MRLSLFALSRHGLLPGGLLGLVLFASEAASQETVNERFNLQIATRPTRSYFAQLDDSEYASLVPRAAAEQPLLAAPGAEPLLLFPVLSRAWPARPLLPDLVAGYAAPRYAPTAIVRKQEELFVQDFGPLVRSRAMVELAESDSPEAAAILMRRLDREADLPALADTLKYLARLKIANLDDRVEPFLSSPHVAVRYQAARLYAIQGKADIAKLVQRATVETDPDLRRHVLEVAAPRATEAPFALWRPFWTHEDPLTRLAAIRPVMRFVDVHAMQDQVLRLVREGTIPERRAVAEGLHTKLSPDFNRAALNALAVADQPPSVRAAAAVALGRLATETFSDLLVHLATDADSDVRLEAARSLRKFSNGEAFEALVALGNDRSLLVRQAARESLIAMQQHYQVDVRIAEAVNSDDALIRNAGYRVIAALGVTAHRDAILAQLRRETAADNLAWGVLALARGNGTNGREFIMTLANHESAAIRAAVAEAIGSLRILDGSDQLMKYAQTDASQEVRTPALISMGQLGDLRFAEALLDICQRTNTTRPGSTSEIDRAIACWAAARLRDGPNGDTDEAAATALASTRDELYRRLLQLVNRPVVIVEMAPPQYDGDIVRVSATWCLADLAQRRAPTLRVDLHSLANEAIRMLKLSDEAAQAASATNPPPSGDALRCYGAEIESFLKQEPVQRAPVPLGTYRFSYLFAEN